MKRFALAALAAVFLFGSANAASAMDDKAVWAQGFINVYFQWLDNADFSKKDGEDDFVAAPAHPHVRGLHERRERHRRRPLRNRQRMGVTRPAAALPAPMVSW